MKPIKVGIAGGAGYTGGELIRLLLQHPNVNIIFIHSKSNARKFIYDVHTDLLGDTSLKFSNTIDKNVDIVFLCLGHGESRSFLEENIFSLKTKIIDLSQDFRWNPDTPKKFVYGLPELQREKIRSAQFIANPGCFATCIQLALLPLAKSKLLKDEIHVSATTGSTGAGQSLNPTTHFSWRSNNHSVYKALEHQHLYEIEQSLKSVQPNFSSPIHFIPQRGSFTRGILAGIYTVCQNDIHEIVSLYKDYYSTHPFVHISNSGIDVKQVVNTNKCFLHFEKKGKYLMITSIIDNLLKGASGQALQNMNLMFGVEENTGLKLKSVAF